MSKKKQSEQFIPADELITSAIQQGRALIEQGRTKVEAASVIFKILEGASQETLVQAFINGANLTPKGALTYWYNLRRKIVR